MGTPAFRGGGNIAVKTPPHEFEALCGFYAKTLGLEQIGESDNSRSFAFGTMRLWVDCVPGLSQAEIWLEVECDDAEAAARYLDEHGIARRDEIESLPEGFRGFWIAAPGNLIHLVTAGD